MLRDLIKFDLLRRIAGQGKQEATHVLFLCLKQAANILPVDGKLVRIFRIGDISGFIVDNEELIPFAEQ